MGLWDTSTDLSPRDCQAIWWVPLDRAGDLGSALTGGNKDQSMQGVRSGLRSHPAQ